jgi:hypothetical protein
MKQTQSHAIKEIQRENDIQISTEQIEEWVNQIKESASTLPHYLENKTFETISQEKANALKKHYIPKFLLEKIEDYRFVDEIHELFRGKYVRWIRLDTKTPFLTNGGIVMDIQFLDNGIQVLCRNGANRFTKYKFDECLTFQKLTDEEMLLLSVKSQI